MINWIENQGTNLYKKLQNCHMREFGETNRPTFGTIISGTKCDRDNPIFFLLKHCCFSISSAVIKLSLAVIKVYSSAVPFFPTTRFCSLLFPFLPNHILSSNAIPISVPVVPIPISRLSSPSPFLACHPLSL